VKPPGEAPSGPKEAERTSLRAFVAVPLPAALVSEYVAVQRALASLRDVKWVEPHNLHLTLKFLGQVQRASAARLGEALARCAARAEPADLGPRSVTALPDERAARVLVVDLEDATGAVRRLQSDVDRELRCLGHPSEERVFRTHVTLGRVREGKLDARAALAGVAVPGSLWGVQAFDLIESRLGPKGPTYVRIRSFRLGALEEG
jgi:2'-5' RNA ligase